MESNDVEAQAGEEAAPKKKHARCAIMTAAVFVIGIAIGILVGKYVQLPPGDLSGYGYNLDEVYVSPQMEMVLIRGDMLLTRRNMYDVDVDGEIRECWQGETEDVFVPIVIKKWRYGTASPPAQRARGWIYNISQYQDLL